MDQEFEGKNIHILGITGNEGSAVLEYVIKQNPRSITGHDFIQRPDLEKNFKTWHKGIDEIKKETEWQKFSNNLRSIKVNLKDKYLENVEEADIIIVPQSWRLYKENEKLKKHFKVHPQRYKTLTQIYLEKTKAKTIGITGTVGKGSTAHLIVEILDKTLPKGKKVYFAGNETWRTQVGGILNTLTSDDILVLEISHRQLIDGIKKAPNIVVFTNIYQNHLDEMSYVEYKNTKFKLLESQAENDNAVLNFDSEELRNISEKLKSKITFFSAKNKEKNIDQVKKHFDELTNANTNQYRDNILAAATCCSLLNISLTDIVTAVKSASSLPARLEKIAEINGVQIYDDIKSTTPWATLKALEKLGKNTILIYGGDTKGMDYTSFKVLLPSITKQAIVLKSKLDENGIPDLEIALKLALESAEKGDNVLISPAAAFFYSHFIKGKKSIKRIITSPLQSEKV